MVSVTAVDNIPLTNNTVLSPTSVRSGDRSIQAYTNRVSPRHFQTLGIPLLAGRDFSVADREGSAAVAIANETLARQLWPGESAIGKYVSVSDGPLIEIVALSRDSKYVSLDEPPKPFLYRPLTGVTVTSPTLLMKTTAASCLPGWRRWV
jgi:hypothetical protein